MYLMLNNLVLVTAPGGSTGCGEAQLWGCVQTGAGKGVHDCACGSGRIGIGIGIETRPRRLHE